MNPNEQTNKTKKQKQKLNDFYDLADVTVGKQSVAVLLNQDMYTLVFFFLSICFFSFDA